MSVLFIQVVQDKPTKIHGNLQDPMTKAVLLFLKATQPIFDKFNLQLQKEEPQIHLMKTACEDLITDLLVRFVKPSAIKDDVFLTNYAERKNQKERDDLVVGSECRVYLAEMKSLEKMSSSQRTDFFDGVRKYYTTALEYILEKFPTSDSLLENAEVVDIGKRKNMHFDKLRYFIERFPAMGVSTEGDGIDELEQEFLKYQVDTKDPDSNPDGRMDTRWHNLRDKYPKLASVALGILSIPHSNAESERVFSAVRRSDTEFRPRMSTKLLESLIVHKTSMKAHKTKCYDGEFSKSLLKEAKSATYQALSTSRVKDTQSDLQVSSALGDDLDLEEMDVCGNVLRLLDQTSLPHPTK